MEIEYASKKIEKYFLNLTKLKQKIGLNLARMAKQRYDQLKAAPSFQTYLTTGLGKPHSLEGKEFEGCYGISLSANVRLIVKPKSKDVSTESLEICTIVIIEGIGDYHGSKINVLIP